LQYENASNYAGFKTHFRTTFKALVTRSHKVWRSEMWYASHMKPEEEQTILDSANAAVEYAVQVRKFHRRRTNRTSQQREQDVNLALARLRDAMQPIRSAIGRFPYEPATELVFQRQERIREASNSIQRERRKLWKLRARKDKV
jgi:hypothetical protein